MNTPNAETRHLKTARRNRLLSAAAAILILSVVYMVVVQFTMNAVALFGYSVLVLPSILLGLAGSAFAFWYWESLSFARGALTACVACVVALTGFLMLGLEGLLTLLMAAPLQFGLTIAGSGLAYAIGRWYRAHGQTALVSLVLLLCVPLFAGMEARLHSGPVLRTAQTEVYVDAPIELVWDVIAQPTDIPHPGDWLFQWGVGYPKRIHVVGEGVGSWRLDDFPTGTYHMRVTNWDPPERMGFGVVEQPVPLTNLNPFHGEIDRLHLAQGVSSNQGEFYLRESGDGVIVRATSWYHNGMFPNFYWGGLIDQIVSRIHLVILNDIKEKAEVTAVEG